MTAPCKLGPRHKWSWQKNVAGAQVGGRGVSFTLRGIYRCACGAKKIGQADHRGDDLLTLPIPFLDQLR